MGERLVQPPSIPEGNQAMVNRETNSDEIKCQQVWREISNYLEDDVDASLRLAMDQHFRTCVRCRSVLEGTRNVVRLYSDERMIEMPAGFSVRMKRRLQQNARAGHSRWSSWYAWMVPLAALLLITGGIRVANSLTVTHPMKTAHGQPAQEIPPDMPVVVTTGAKLFHASGCPFIHNKQTERILTAREAMREGYVPCLRCMRKYLNTTIVGKGAGSGTDNPDLYANQDDDDLDAGGGGQ